MRVRLLDYKTSKPNNMSTAKDLKDGKALQLAAYAVAFDALRVQGKLPSSIPAAAILQQLTLFTVRTGKENTAAMDHLVSHCQKLIGNAAKAIHEGKLAPVPRKGCLLGGGHGFCDFADLCRARHIPQNWLRNGYEETKPADATVPTPTGGQQP